MEWRVVFVWWPVDNRRPKMFFDIHCLFGGRGAWSSFRKLLSGSSSLLCISAVIFVLRFVVIRSPHSIWDACHVFLVSFSLSSVTAVHRMVWIRHVDWHPSWWKAVCLNVYKYICRDIYGKKKETILMKSSSFSFPLRGVDNCHWPACFYDSSLQSFVFLWYICCHLFCGLELSNGSEKKGKSGKYVIYIDHMGRYSCAMSVFANWVVRGARDTSPMDWETALIFPFETNIQRCHVSQATSGAGHSIDWVTARFNYCQLHYNGSLGL